MAKVKTSEEIKYGEELLIQEFEAWVKQFGLEEEILADEGKYLIMFKSAFMSGVTAHANGQYY